MIADLIIQDSRNQDISFRYRTTLDKLMRLMPERHVVPDHVLFTSIEAFSTE